MKYYLSVQEREEFNQLLLLNHQLFFNCKTNCSYCTDTATFSGAMYTSENA